MKIDFLGRYKDVAKLIEAPTKPAEQQKAPTEFATLLRDISPFAPKATEIVQETEIVEPLVIPTESEDSGPMARFNFPLPELDLPGLSLIEVSPALPDDVKEAEISVKSPEGLEARRVRVGVEALHELPRQERISTVGKLIDAEGTEQGVDPVLGMAVANTESNFNPLAVSKDGHASKGIFQLLDSTGSQLFNDNNIEGKYNPFDPQQNVKLGVSYLRKLHEIFSSATKLPNNLSTVAAANSSSLEKLAVAAFNAGEGRVASAQDRAQRAGMNPSDYDSVSIYLPESTQEYVQKVLDSKLQFESEINTEE